jgi:hypothetical protein
VMRILAMLETAVTLVIPPILIVAMNASIIHGLFQFNHTFKPHENQHSFISRLETTNDAENPHEVNIQVCLS